MIEALSNPIRYINLMEQRASQLAALTQEEGGQELNNKEVCVVEVYIDLCGYVRACLCVCYTVFVCELFHLVTKQLSALCRLKRELISWTYGTAFHPSCPIKLIQQWKSQLMVTSN